MLEYVTKKISLTELWVTEIGSFMWGMNTLSSDHDYHITYIADTRDVFLGRIDENLSHRPGKDNITSDGLPSDISGMEIGALIRLLKKGNINAIWATISPKVVAVNPSFSDDMDKLRALIVDNRGLLTYYSVRGLAQAQLADAEKRAAVRPSHKSLVSALRTIEFGLRWLNGDDVVFEPPTIYKNVTVNTVKQAISDLGKVFDKKSIPDKIDEKLFDDFLYNLRLKRMGVG